MLFQMIYWEFFTQNLSNLGIYLALSVSKTYSYYIQSSKIKKKLSFMFMLLI